MEENMIRGAILAMNVDNETKRRLFNWLDNLVGINDEEDEEEEK